MSSLLSACGQPGPLYLPKPPAKGPAGAATDPMLTPAPVPPPPPLPTPLQ